MMDRIGPYPVDRVLGTGGFGTVYAGRHPQTGQAVAIKALDRMGGDQASVRAQLLAEAEALRSVRSPHCLQVFDVVDDDGVLALVTEYVDAVTLRALLDERGPLGGPEALTVLWGAAQGLAAVHAAGMVHGDLKPANILTDAAGTSRLIDFGLATAPGWIAEDALAPWGSPAYASPEQVSHGYRDHRSDLYSLTVTLYEVLCGQRPFAGPTLEQVRWKHVHEPVPDPRLLVGDLGDELTQLLLWGTMKDPAARVPDIATWLQYFEAAAAARYGASWAVPAAVGSIAASVVGAGLVSGVLGGGSSAVAAGGAAAAGSAGSAGALGASAGGTGVAGTTSAGTAASTGLFATGGAKIAAAVTVGALTVGGGTAAVVTDGFGLGGEDAAGSGNGGVHGQRTGALTVAAPTLAEGLSLAGGPSHTWDFDPSSVDPGATLGYVGPLGRSSPGTGVVAVGDVVVATTTNTSTDHLIGLDAATGELLWDNEMGSACWGVGDNRLLCDDHEDGQLVLLDAASGEQVAQRPRGGHCGYTDSDYLAIDDGAIYFGESGSDGVVVSALDPHTLEADWSTDLDSLSECFLHHTGKGLAVKQFAGDGYLLDLDGTVTGRSVSDGFLEDGYEFLVADDQVTVKAPDGRTVVAATGHLWPAAEGYVVNGRVGIGSAMYDVATGEAVWRHPGLAHGYPNYALRSDDDRWALAVGCEDCGDSHDSVLVDAVTGETRWTGQTVNDDYMSRHLMRGDGIVGVSPYFGELTVASLATGEQAWVEPLSDLSADSDHPDVGFVVADAAVIGYGGFGVRGFTGFDAAAGGAEADDDSEYDGDAYRTKCGSPPEFVPVEVETATGGVAITFEVHAVCAGGQWLNWSQLRVPLLVDGDHLADGYFDFSGSPYWIPDDGTRMSLVYPYQNLTAPVQVIDQAIRDDGGSGTVIVVPCEPGPDNTEDAPVPPAPVDPGDEPVVASGDTAASDEERQESALEALQRIAAEDESAVAALEWTAQLSSKRPGTRDDGIVYDTYDEILELHLQHRARYPTTLLAWSGDWPGSYGPSSADYWVTLSGISESRTRPVLRWCRQEGWGDGDCWAKRLSVNGKPEDNTDHAPPDERNN